jgi:hypothetical protein
MNKWNNRTSEGKRMNPETRAKISATMLGNHNALGKLKSTETRAKISAALLGNHNAPGNSLGMRGSSEYHAYIDAKQRCTNPKNESYRNYGGRGIQFLFTSFAQFIKYIGPKPTPQHSLDRFPNNDGHYEPGNVRWAQRR